MINLAQAPHVMKIDMDWSEQVITAHLDLWERRMRDYQYCAHDDIVWISGGRYCLVCGELLEMVSA